MSTPLGVTGATGVVGGLVARALADAGVEQRLVLRDPSRAPALPGASVAQAAYGEPEALRRALDGLDTVLMVSAAESAGRLDEHRCFVDAAADAGARHVVYLSFFGAAPDATFTLARDHYATEEHLKASGMRWTFLRDNLYADYLPLFAGTEHVLRGPAGDGRGAAVAQRDVGAVAAAVLTDAERHAGTTYHLTGPEALTLAEAAEVMTRVTGAPHRFEDETLEEAYASRRGYGAPDWQLDAWVSTYTAIARGELAGVTGDVERLTGRPATSLEQLLR